MKQSPFSPLLQSLGLNEGEALLYGILLESGTLTARELTEQSGIGRGNVYNTLVLLVRRGLVLEIEGKKTAYQAADPNTLRKLLAGQEARLRELAGSFETGLTDLESAYRLALGRPTIQMFEGIEGAKIALDDSLTSKTEILTYFDPSAMTGPIVEINRAYVRKRIAKKLSKRIIAADGPAAHAFFTRQKTPFTRVAYLPDFPEQHATGMEIYDGAISYLTLKDDRRISVIIRDAAIYELHRRHFEFLWGLARETAGLVPEGTGSNTTTRRAGSAGSEK